MIRAGEGAMHHQELSGVCSPHSLWWMTLENTALLLAVYFMLLCHPSSMCWWFHVLGLGLKWTEAALIPSTPLGAHYVLCSALAKAAAAQQAVWSTEHPVLAGSVPPLPLVLTHLSSLPTSTSPNPRALLMLIPRAQSLAHFCPWLLRTLQDFTEQLDKTQASSPFHWFPIPLSLHPRSFRWAQTQVSPSSLC